MTAVLLSAGLDSAVLAAAEAKRGQVLPIYVSVGLAWEREERAMLERLLASPPYATCLPLIHLTFSADDLYPANHWARRGEPPAFDTPDADVYLMGRNIMLLSKSAIYCVQRHVVRLAIGPLAGNPFPDATPQFFSAMGSALSLGLDSEFSIETPFANLRKEDVILLGIELGVPLALTLSCMRPASGEHCGLCSKCRERRDAFRAAGVADPTSYATAPLR